MSEITSTLESQGMDLSAEKNLQNEENDKKESKQKYASCEEVITRLKELMELPVSEVKKEVESLKSLFYKIRRAEIDAECSSFLKDGGKLENFIPSGNNKEEEVKSILEEFKRKRMSLEEISQKDRENNSKTKQEIISRIQTMLEATDDVGKYYTEFQKLRQSWNETGEVPPTEETKLWKEYQKCVERFYDLLKINKELREYDFKKNLELKTELCEKVERLLEEEDVLSAFRTLQELHNKWRSIGPVSKDLREELWARFKTASTNINKKHQAFFDKMHEGEVENEKKKKEICEKLKAIDYSVINTTAKWEEKTKEVVAMQAEWKNIGPTTRKNNRSIYENFRDLCDGFFEKKSTYFKEMRENLSSNLEAKKKLCEEAESLKDSIDWRVTTDKLIALQKEWKKIGAVPRKFSDELWNRFSSACNAFFEKKKTEEGDKRGEEKSNLEAKKSIIEKLKAIDGNLPKEEIIGSVRKFISEFNSIGHVPFKEKEKVYKEFNGLVDNLFKKFDFSASKERMKNFKKNISERISKGEQEVDGVKGERRRLLRQLETMKNELFNYENNMSFLNFSSKNSSKLKEEMDRKVSKLKEDILALKDKIKVIDESVENPAPAEKEGTEPNA